MNDSTARRRAVWSRALMAIAIVAALGACTAQGGGETPPTTTLPPWLDAGCLGSATPGPPYDHLDANFNGTPNVVNNTTLLSTNDGSCTGSPLATATLIQAADQTAADALCLSLALGTPAIYLPTSYAVPVDAWGCLTVI